MTQKHEYNSDFERKMVKFGKGMSFCMSLTMSFFCSLIGTLASGHFTVIGFIVSFIISFIFSMLIGFVSSRITRAKSGNSTAKAVSIISDMQNENVKHTSKTIAFSALISDLTYTPVLTLVMVAVGMTMTGVQIDRQAASLKQQISVIAAQAEAASEEEKIVLKQQAAEMETAKEQMLLAKPPVKAYPLAFLKSFIVIFPACYFLCFVFQPVYAKALKKKYGLTDEEITMETT